MALINCPDCQKEISDTARICVHCGYRRIKSVFIQELGFDGEVFRIMIVLGLLTIVGGTIAQNALVIAGGIQLVIFAVLFLLIRAIK